MCKTSTALVELSENAMLSTNIENNNKDAVISEINNSLMLTIAKQTNVIWYILPTDANLLINSISLEI